MVSQFVQNCNKRKLLSDPDRNRDMVIKGKIKIIGNGTVVNRDENFIRFLMIKIEMNPITASFDMSHICESSKVKFSFY